MPLPFPTSLLAPATPSNTARSGGTDLSDRQHISGYPRLRTRAYRRQIGTYVMWTAFATTAVTSSLFLTALAPNAAALAIAREIVNVDIGWSAMVYRLCAARNSVAAAGAAIELHRCAGRR